MAARTISPTSLGLAPAARNALTCAMTVSKTFASSAVTGVGGWVSRLFETICVLTGPGHNTLTPMLNGSSACRSDSERPTTANFEVVYRRPLEGAATPAPEAALENCPTMGRH